MGIKYAVLTGDIIRSSAISPEQRVILNNTLNALLNEYKDIFNFKSELYRGDSFQCLVFDPKDSLRLALLIKSFIRHLDFPEMMDARIAIGIGNIDHQEDSLANSHGEAFALSGRALDSIKDSKQTLTISTADKYNSELQIESFLLDTIMLKNTAAQSAVINLKLRGFTEIQIAKALGIMQSAVNQRSTGANWNAIHLFVNHFEKLYTS